MRAIWIPILTFTLGLPVWLYAADEPKAAGDVPDVQTIVNKANIVAYYQGDDGKAKVNMVITDKGGGKPKKISIYAYI